MSNLLEGLVLGLHLISYHPEPGFNNVNPGIYVKTEAGITAGVYHNSERRTSVYVGYTANLWGPVDVTYGVITGYRKGPMPMVLPTVRLPDLGGFTPRLAYVPKLNAKGSAAVHLMLERSF